LFTKRNEGKNKSVKGTQPGSGGVGKRLETKKKETKKEGRPKPGFSHTPKTVPHRGKRKKKSQKDGAKKLLKKRYKGEERGKH